MKERTTVTDVRGSEFLGAAIHALHLVWSHASSSYASKKLHEALTPKSLSVMKPLVCVKSAPGNLTY